MQVAFQIMLALRLLRAVGRRGKLARWFGEHGHPEPAAPPATEATP
ncbi:hypothetical protein QCN29_00965 [Streptomyces sp. HNM0663]|uniref:Uncharacterized protein n=1 Tax=Streptomyces chengmaiensis TaxID=3040919 RepID=A0ABT6HGH1_9ACTN|nr:hypothetical protein [Streptomyces chengmaiensis]MDH2387377.1 hypothetical protein [Streptomyces chengmaiensis]